MPLEKSNRQLTPRQERFVAEYLIDLNGAKACTRAGYAARNADRQAYKLLEVPAIRAAIDAGKAALSKQTGITAERTINEIALIAFADPARLISVRSPEDIAALPEDVRRCIVGWKYTEWGFEIRLESKISALDKLMRHLSQYNDKLAVDVTVGLADRLARAKRRKELRDISSGSIEIEVPVPDARPLSEPAGSITGNVLPLVDDPHRKAKDTCRYGS